jgi:very-short-patch-repair endonuclease
LATVEVVNHLENDGRALMSHPGAILVRHDRRRTSRQPARRQAGAISRAQAQACGLTRRMIERRVSSGRWTPIHRGVYSIAGVPPSWLTTVWAAALAAGEGAVVSHETALLLDGLSDRMLPRRPIKLTLRHGTHPYVPGAIVHQLGDLAPRHIARHRSGLMVTTAARGIVDVSATVGERHLGHLVDDLIVARLVSLAQISCCLRDVTRRGKPGVRALGRVLDDRRDGYVPPHSELERKLFEVLAAGGLPRPRRQVPLPGRGAIEGVVDAAYPDVRLVIEADGRRWHTRVRDLARDHLRDAEAARVGWQTLRLLYEQIVGDPHETCATVHDVQEARRGLGTDAA